MPAQKKKYRVPVVAPAVVDSPPVIQPAFLNVEQAAVYFGVTIWTIRRLISTGKLAAKQIGKRFTVRRADLDALWQAEKTVEPKATAA